MLESNSQKSKAINHEGTKSTEVKAERQVGLKDKVFEG
jgi:hypothetical protein